jgi:thiamine-monophosphate kinase
MLENINKTDLSQLGEFGLIKHLTKNIELINESSIKGVGDDAAIIDNKHFQTVISTDMLMEGVHFDLTYVPLKHLGYKSVAVNLSDIYAMNAQPKQILISMAISSRFSLEAIEEFYNGVYLACKNYKIDLVGGDTTSSQSGMAISITAIGQVEAEKAVYRNTAKEKDLLVVSGDLGGAYMGLQVLEREKEVFKSNPNMQPDLEGCDYILERQLKPEPRADIIRLLKDLDVHPNAMIDISDGLASEILHLCNQSEVGCQLFEEKIPIDPTTIQKAVDFNLNPTVAALNGGEDYELLFTIPMSEYEKIKGNPNLTVIGHITNKNNGVNLVTNSGSQVALTAQGWDAFLKNENK